MNLVLALSNPELLPETLRTRQIEFGKTGGTIGRHDDCDWVLDDPERFVSSRHAVVKTQKSNFVLEDVSTNGTFVNDQLVGKGNKVTLSTGDVIRIGRFVMLAELRGNDGTILGEAAPAVDLLQSDPSVVEMVEGIADNEDGIDEFLDGHDEQNTIEESDDLLSGHSTGIQDALAPIMVAESGKAIPEDWWEGDPLDDQKDLEPFPEEDVTEQSLEELISTPAVPQIEVETETEDLLDSELAQEQDDFIEPASEPAPQVAPTVAVTPAPISRPKRKSSPQNKASVEDQLDFTHSFHEALNLDPSFAEGHTGYVLGSVLREVLSGSLGLLGARSSFRNELRLQNTMVGARENNPLKFSINHLDAVDRLLKGETSGFMEPVQATSEMMTDISQHQIGVVAGIQAGIDALLTHLDPNTVVSAKGIMGIPTTLTKLKERHEALLSETTERMDGVFWRAFSRAYDQAIAQASNGQV